MSSSSTSSSSSVAASSGAAIATSSVVGSAPSGSGPTVTYSTLMAAIQEAVRKEVSEAVSRALPAHSSTTTVPEAAAGRLLIVHTHNPILICSKSCVDQFYLFYSTTFVFRITVQSFVEYGGAIFLLACCCTAALA
uniref:Uncharacterized protein n=1 Tax=Amphimedon queenslandica TaxID=400682 RepID=A0A1X7T1R9_AMPQE